MKLAYPVHWCAVLLALSATAFGVWTWQSGARERTPRAVQNSGVRKAGPQFQATDADVLPGRSLADLRPGMPRTEVEQLLGGPTPKIQPAVVHNARVTYCVTYPVTLVPPAGPGQATGSPTAFVTLEFDATKPGHPLIGTRGPETTF